MTVKSHMGMFLYECPVCGHICKNRWTMIDHLEKYHKGIKIRDCKRISTRTYEYIETKVEEDD